jgi:hypothetical protein
MSVAIPASLMPQALCDPQLLRHELRSFFRTSFYHLHWYRKDRALHAYLASHPIQYQALYRCTKFWLRAKTCTEMGQRGFERIQHFSFENDVRTCAAHSRPRLER